jgi:TetR/AcrR family transcriptional repressor of nem operon
MSSSASSNLNPHQPPGRPRGFVPSQALQAALQLFWNQGFEPTSLDDLTTAMGISRSSLYGYFGSKHAVLMAAVIAYADDCYAEFSRAAAGDANPKQAVKALLTAIADPQGGRRGCFFVNTVTELGPHDPAVQAFAQTHIKRVAGLVAATIARAGIAQNIAAERAGAMLAIAIGAISLRKAGVAAAQITGLLAQAELLFPT